MGSQTTNLKKLLKISVGLIDIKRRGKYGQPALYAISDRWKNYGTESFVVKDVPKNPTNGGFQKGNKYGRNHTAEDREQYHQQITAPKIKKLQDELNELNSQKQLSHYDEKSTPRLLTVIDARIDCCTRKLKKIEGM